MPSGRATVSGDPVDNEKPASWPCRTQARKAAGSRQYHGLRCHPDRRLGGLLSAVQGREMDFAVRALGYYDLRQTHGHRTEVVTWADTNADQNR